jgi:hypothetical protein
MVIPSSLIGSMDPIAMGAAMGNLRMAGTPDPAD